MSLTARTSRTIRVARVLCILSMVTVHIWPGAGRILAADWSLAQSIFFQMLIDYLGRASVPLLSIFSGVLLAQTMARGARPSTVIQKKFRTLMVPIFLWSLPLLGLTMVKARLIGDTSPLPQTTVEWINALTGLTARPANEPLHFLRDIFAMSIIGIGLLALLRRWPFFAGGLAIAFALWENLSGGLILLRPQIGTFYLVGIAIFLSGRANTCPPIALSLTLLAAATIISSGLAFADSGWLASLESHVFRLAMSLAMWNLAFHIAGSQGLAARAIERLEPDIFIIFCTHMITVKLCGGFARFFEVSLASPYYTHFFLAQLAAIVLFGLAISRALRALPTAPRAKAEVGTRARSFWRGSGSP